MAHQFTEFDHNNNNEYNCDQTNIYNSPIGDDSNIEYGSQYNHLHAHWPFTILASEASAKSIPTLDKPPTALHFYREYIAQNKPVIIKNAINDWLR
jgi:hypothetical protein